MGIIRVCDVCGGEVLQKIGKKSFIVNCDTCLLNELSQKAQATENFEIERVFLLGISPEKLFENQGIDLNRQSVLESKAKMIYQVYLNSNDDRVSRRVRLIHPPRESGFNLNKYYFTEKEGRGELRLEKEISLSLLVGQRLLSLPGFIVKKLRVNYFYTYINKQKNKESVCVEVDFFYYFANDVNGVYSQTELNKVLIEVEFDSQEQAANFVAPDWFGKEVTDDVRFTNRQIAEYGWPKGVI